MATDEYCFDIDVIEGSKAGNPLLRVIFKEGYTNYWKSNNTWVPTLAELEFLYKNKKMMEHSIEKK